jgi:hypothetical protein
MAVRGHHDATGERTQGAEQGGSEKKTGATEHDGNPCRVVLQETPARPPG